MSQKSKWSSEIQSFNSWQKKLFHKNKANFLGCHRYYPPLRKISSSRFVKSGAIMMWLQWEGNRWWKTTVWKTGVARKSLRSGTKTGDFYAGYKFRITPKFRYTLIVPESTVLSLADRWTRGPLSVSSSSPSGPFFLLSLPRAFSTSDA